MRYTVEVEYARRETVEFEWEPNRHDGASGMGAFDRALRYHAMSGRDLALREEARILNWRADPLPDPLDEDEATVRRGDSS